MATETEHILSTLRQRYDEITAYVPPPRSRAERLRIVRTKKEAYGLLRAITLIEGLDPEAATTDPRGALGAILEASPSADKPLHWHPHFNDSGVEAWNSEDGKWRVAKDDAGYALAARFLGSLSPLVLGHFSDSVDAFGAAATLSQNLDPEGFTNLAGLITYWKNAYDAQHLSLKEARAEADSVARHDASSVENWEFALLVRDAASSRLSDAYRVLNDIPADTLAATHVIDTMRRHLRLVASALNGTDLIARCEHCKKAITQQTDGTWWAQDGAVTLCAPELPHTPLHTSRVTSSYQESLGAQQDEITTLRLELDTLKSENSVTAASFLKRAQYCKERSTKVSDPDFASRWETMALVYNRCYLMLAGREEASIADVGSPTIPDTKTIRSKYPVATTFMDGSYKSDGYKPDDAIPYQALHVIQDLCDEVDTLRATSSDLASD